MRSPVSAEISTDSGESCLELMADTAVHQEVGGAVEHDQEVSHGLQAHHPQGRDILHPSLLTAHLHLCNHHYYHQFIITLNIIYI